jgi:membrane-associated protein
VGVTLLGFFAGASYKTVEKAVGRSSAAFLVVLVLGAIFVWHRRRRKARS